MYAETVPFSVNEIINICCLTRTINRISACHPGTFWLQSMSFHSSHEFLPPSNQTQITERCITPYPLLLVPASQTMVKFQLIHTQKQINCTNLVESGVVYFKCNSSLLVLRNIHEQQFIAVEKLCLTIDSQIPILSWLGKVFS